MRQSKISKNTFYSIGAANFILFILLCAYCTIDFAELVYFLISGNIADINISIWSRILAEIAIVFLAFIWVKPVSALKIRIPRPNNLFYSILLSFFAYLPLSVAINFISELLITSGAEIPENLINETVMAMPFIVEFLYFCVLAPFAEEILFRGVIQNAYERKSGIYAFIIAGALFGLMHADPISSLNGIIVGSLFGYVYIKTRSIWCPIVMHMSYNLFAFTMLPDIFIVQLPWALGIFPMETMTFSNTGYAVYSIGIAAIGILMCYILIRLLQKNNTSNRAQRAADYRPVPAQWVILACSIVLLAVRLMLVTYSYIGI